MTDRNCGNSDDGLVMSYGRLLKTTVASPGKLITPINTLIFLLFIITRQMLSACSKRIASLHPIHVLEDRPRPYNQSTKNSANSSELREATYVGGGLTCIRMRILLLNHKAER